MSNNTSSSSYFHNLIARLLINEIFDANNAHRTTNTRNNPLSSSQRDASGNTHIHQTPPAQQINNESTMQPALIGLMREYNMNISQYNNNITQYNRNVDTIIHLLDSAYTPINACTAVPPVRSSSGNTFIPSSFDSQRFDPSRNNMGSQPYSMSYRNTDTSSNYIQIETPVQEPETPRVLFQYFRLPDNARYNNLWRTSTDGLTEGEIIRSTNRLIFDVENFADNNLSTQCPITLEEFTQDEQLLKIRNCKHIFRPNELRRWFSQHSRCPVCRGNPLLESNAGPVGDTSESSLHPTGPTGHFIAPNSLESFGDNSGTQTEDTNAGDYSDMPELIEYEYGENTEEPEQTNDGHIYNFEYSYYFDFPQNQRW